MSMSSAMTAAGEDSSERLSRAELAVVLQKASDIQASAPLDDGVSLAEAELLAAEVGIPTADFREAVRLLRSNRVGDTGWLGPTGAFAAEATIPRGVRPDEALHMLAQAQVVLPSPRASIDSAAPGLWRLSDGSGALLQVSTRGETTTLAASLDRTRTRLGMIGGGGVAGTVLGALILPAAAIALSSTVEALAVANVVGIVGGAAAGVAAGRAAWRGAARQARARLLAALDRMREVAEEGSEQAQRQDGAHVRRTAP